MSDYFDTHVEVQYLNKPYFVQLKRVWRMAKKIKNKDKSKKLGFYLQQLKDIPGSAETSEKIVRSIFGKSQELTPKKFIERIFDHETPEGKQMFIRSEDAYQTTQRLIPDKKKNKTISISIFSEIYNDIINELIKEYGQEKGDNIARSLNKYLSSHFSNAAGFIRWTNMSPTWIHIDAIQTDFFNNLKALGNNNPEYKPFIDKIRKHEIDFFKTAMSYIVRTHPGVKIFTVNDENTVKAVENIRGSVKLKKYYHQIPKKLGFKLIRMDDFFNKVLRTRPGKNTEKLIQKFGKALKSYTNEDNESYTKDDIIKFNASLSNKLTEKSSKITQKEHVDMIIQTLFQNATVSSAYHQYIDAIFSLMQRAKEEKKNIKNTIKAFLDTKTDTTLSSINKKRTSIGGNIWWSNRELVFESTQYDNRMVLHKILEAVRK